MRNMKKICARKNSMPKLNIFLATERSKLRGDGMYSLHLVAKTMIVARINGRLMATTWTTESRRRFSARVPLGASSIYTRGSMLTIKEITLLTKDF